MLRVTFADLTAAPTGLLGVTSIARRQRFLRGHHRRARVCGSRPGVGPQRLVVCVIGPPTRLSLWHFHDPLQLFITAAAVKLRRTSGEVLLPSSTGTGFNLLRLLSDFYVPVDSLASDKMQITVNWSDDWRVKYLKTEPDCAFSEVCPEKCGKMAGKVIITVKVIRSLLLKTLWGSISFSLQQTIKCSAAFAYKVSYYFPHVLISTL